ncbi:MAG: alpha/beta hydrolase, partial [Pseudomonadota bacterium]
LTPTRLAYLIAQHIEVNPNLIRLEDFMPYLEHISRVDLSLFFEILGHAARHTAEEILPWVKVPTLIIAGARDGFTPRWLSEEMHRRIPGAELLVVEDGSHTTPIEEPAVVIDAIERHLAKAGL